MTFDPQQADIGALEQLLARSGIDLASWGPPGAATVADLFAELRRGESELELSPLVRRLRIVRLDIRDGDGRQLMERRVIRADGRVQERNARLSEKMLRGEDVTAAIWRALREELPVPLATFRILQIRLPREEERASAPSYPGLRSVYNIHEGVVATDTLPRTDFATAEFSATGQRIVHEWTWIGSDEHDPD